MKGFNKLFFSKIFRFVILPVIIINTISVFLLFIISLFVDYQTIYQKLPFSELVEFQVVFFASIIIFEIGLIFIIIYRFFNNSTNTISDVQELLAKGENNKVEFKSSLRFDYNENKINKELEYVITKTISAFLNTYGGIILIGVDDDGKILGIKNDYETLKKKNSDGFLVYFTQMINHYLGKETHRYLNIDIEKFEEKEICLIQISPAQSPIYVNNNNQREFFIRTASSVQPMDVRDAHNYIVNHWKEK